MLSTSTPGGGGIGVSPWRAALSDPAPAPYRNLRNRETVIEDRYLDWEPCPSAAPAVLHRGVGRCRGLPASAIRTERGGVAERPDDEAEKERWPGRFLRTLLDGEPQARHLAWGRSGRAGTRGAAGSRRLNGVADPRRADQPRVIDSPYTATYRRRASRWDGLRAAPLGPG